MIAILDETSEKYQAWTLATQTQMIAQVELKNNLFNMIIISLMVTIISIHILQAAATTTRITQEFTEEMVNEKIFHNDNHHHHHHHHHHPPPHHLGDS